MPYKHDVDFVQLSFNSAKESPFKRGIYTLSSTNLEAKVCIFVDKTWFFKTEI